MIELPTAALRLGLALAFGAIIGVEREWRLKQAGLKTMSLVALGSSAFALMTNTFGPGNHNPGQIAAAVVGGIGFLGAGVIMHRGVTVQGLTTAATLWASASVGVASGLGQLPLAVTLTALIVLMQIAGRRIEVRIRRMRHRRLPGRFELRVDCDGESLPAVNGIWEAYGPPVTRTVRRMTGRLVLTVVLTAKEGTNVSALEEKLIGLAGVNRVDVRHLGVEEES